MTPVRKEDIVYSIVHFAAFCSRPKEGKIVFLLQTG